MRTGRRQPLDRRDRGHLRRRSRRRGRPRRLPLLVVRLPREGVTWVVNVDEGCECCGGARRRGTGCQVLCQVGVLHLRVKNCSDLQIGLTMVSERHPLPPVWAGPRAPRWPVDGLVFPRVAVASQGRAGCLRAWLHLGVLWSRLGTEEWSIVGLRAG